MTAKQAQFITTLAAEKDLSTLRPEQREYLAKVVAGDADPGAATSRMISALLALDSLRPTSPAANAPVVEVAAGRYAIDLDGKLHFFRVDRPEDGKWAGRTFVKEQASEDYFPVRGPRAKQVLAAIAADAEGAMIRYGHELGRCGNCGRTLTDETSRAMGIGPDCAKHLGIDRGVDKTPRPTPAEVVETHPVFAGFSPEARATIARNAPVEETTAAPAVDPLPGPGDRYENLRAAAAKPTSGPRLGWRETKAAVARQQADAGTRGEKYRTIANESGRIHMGELPGNTWEDIFGMGGS